VFDQKKILGRPEEYFLGCVTLLPADIKRHLDGGCKHAFQCYRSIPERSLPTTIILAEPLRFWEYIISPHFFENMGLLVGQKFHGNSEGGWGIRCGELLLGK